MKLFPKFIIEEENMILKIVKNHRDIATNATKVKGGAVSYSIAIQIVTHYTVKVMSLVLLKLKILKNV
jgi:hypothetical protein